MDPTKKLFSLAEEFKNFAFKGNVIDMAVGIVIGTAFGAIVNSLVKNIIMPLLGLISPQGGYNSWHYGEIAYGQFVGDVLNFLIIALAMFVFIVKFLGWILRARQAAPPPPSLTRDQELLAEIRDLLKAR